MKNKQLLLKVRGGTRPTGKRLCDTCSNGVVMTGQADSNEVIYCHEIDEYVPLTVSTCTSYKDKNAPSLYDMRAIAWQLSTDKKGHSIGFVSPQKWREQRRVNGDDPYDYED